MACKFSHRISLIFLLVFCPYLVVKFTRLGKFSVLITEKGNKESRNWIPLIPFTDKLSESHKGGVNSEEDDILFPDDVKVELVSDTEDWEMKKRYNRTVSCPGTKRTISFHRSYRDYEAVSKADVVHVITKAPREVWNKLLETRSSNQIWLFSSAESAPYSPPIPSTKRKPYPIALDLKFNMSFFYHPKAEVYAPFGAYIPWESEQLKLLKDVKLSPKEDIGVPAAWASSHCIYGFWNRTRFAHDLSKLIKTDLYGDCGNKPLPRDHTGNMILKKYKFYFAFENHCCSYYISEKFWLALSEYEAVPVVMGSLKSEYQKVAPPNSFIHVDDFHSLQDLANYLTRVANDDSLYMQYHKWRDFGYVEVYHSHNVFPYVEDKMSCRLLDFLERNAWKPGRPMQMKLDLYGPDWLGSCNVCGKKPWLLDYNNASKFYHQNFTNALKQAKALIEEV